MDGNEALPAGAPSRSDGLDDLRIRPVSDARLRLAGDVRRVHGSEGAVVTAPSGIHGLSLLGVTPASPGRPEDVLSPSHLVRGGGKRSGGQGRENPQETEADAAETGHRG